MPDPSFGSANGVALANLVFDDITPIEIPVEISGKHYILREATGEAAAKWRSAMLRCTKLGPGGVPESVTGLAETELLLVALCLFEVVEGAANKPVTMTFVANLPYRVTGKLFETAKRISGLDADEKAEDLRKRIEEDSRRLELLEAGGMAKNLPPDIMAG